ncbi:hypothetical protein B0H13DRAFT_1895558 [Mycena leptocephala]|nr:hypothetical protein B0H13DRAFT_1895558 [Mycena leptocephala]
MDANVPSEQHRVSTPDPVSHHVRTLNFALPQTAANVHRCDYCQKTFSSNRRRNQHARQLQHGVAAGSPPMRTTQPPANRYRCGDCQKTFSSNVGLNQHARTVHTLAAAVAVQPTPTQTTQSPAKLHRCNDCQKTFASKGERKRHSRTMHTLAAIVAVQPTPMQTTQPRRFSHRILDLSFAASRTAAKVYPAATAYRLLVERRAQETRQNNHKGAARPLERKPPGLREDTREPPQRSSAQDACGSRTVPRCALGDHANQVHHHIPDAMRRLRQTRPKPPLDRTRLRCGSRKMQREADIALKRRMSGHSRGRVQVDRLALDFGAAAGPKR